MNHRQSFVWEWRYWLAGLFALTLVVFGASLNNLFVPFDDNTLIYTNWAIQKFSVASISHIFTSYDPELYIPLTLFVYQLMHLVFGFSPGAYHALSLLLHLVNIGLVAWVVWLMSKKKFVALGVASLFAIHPLQSEAILWASALKDLLSSAFGLLSLGFYLRYRSSSSQKIFWWCIGCFALGLLAKVSIAPLPLIFLLVDWLQCRSLQRSTWIKKWPFFGLTALFVIIALAGKTRVIGGAGIVTTLLLACKATAYYLLKFVWPTHLSVMYPQPVLPSFAQPEILASIIVVICLIIVAFIARNRYRFVSFSIFWYLLFLAPSFSNFYKNEYFYFASDRYAYLPSIGIFFIVITAITGLCEKKKVLRNPMIVVWALGILTLAIVAHARVAIWHDGKALFGNVIAEYPMSVVAYNNLGTEFHNTPEALSSYQKALALDPNYIVAYRNSVRYYEANGDTDNLKMTYAKGIAALESKPHPTRDDWSLLYAYAEYLDTNSDSTSAVALLQKAVELNPDVPESHYNLGVKFQKYGRMDDAQKELQRAVDLDGQKTDALYHLAAVDAQKGQLQDATDLLVRLVAIDPNYPQAQRHLDDLRGMTK